MSLDEYNVLKVIGRGTYGEVHLVTCKKDRKQYVIKKMALVKASAKERKAAEQEAKLLSDLRHPNIVSYKDSFESESGHLYIVMGFAEGGDLYTKLRDHREKKDPLSEQRTVRWYIQICMALQYLHERRILHRDLKTQNIFLTKTNMIKVGDLGIARVLESANDMATTLIGTPYYMSPELFSNRPYNHKSDVWALGCCMYEMVTLKHAFNAKDINSLMYKILKGKMPPMPDEYSSALCHLIKDMLNQNPDKRPSVNRILRNPFIKEHIKLFLQESSSRKRRPASERSSRKSSVASSGAGSRPASARKASTNNRGSCLSPSPHPPAIASEPNKASRVGRARSPNSIKPVSVVSDSQKDSNRSSPKQSSPQIMKEIRDPLSPLYPIDNPKQEPKDIKTDYTSITKPKVVSSSPKPQIVSPPLPSNISHAINTNSNNSRPGAVHNDSGIYVNFAEPHQYEKVEIRNQHSSPKPSSANSEKSKSPRANSASSSCSSSSRTSSSASNASKRNRRPLPSPVITPSFEYKPDNHLPKSDRNILHASGESVASSVVSSATNDDGTPRISSARQRRRERQRKEKSKTPPIVEEIRRSRNSGIIQPDSSKRDAKPSKAIRTKEKSREKKLNNEVFADVTDGASGDRASVVSRSHENDTNQALGNIEQQQQPEIEEFMTLLHTTLHLGSERESNNTEEQGGELSPVPELSESSSSSTVTNQSNPYSRNTPAATPINVPGLAPNKLRSDAKQGISGVTLRSTQRLMDRIVSLRKDCIQGLGVPLLHRAYEVLDANENDDALQEELIALLGRVRFEQWAGKIWQLKYCEESMFEHCGTITAF
uniref:serine/threonine-protein kinase Nek4-like n=1 Tax=Styela clava TaxID=7725 RepID=UPI00193A45F0|nr:serine/threonine-protein kinase Nek4-like [Styela clava]